MAKYSLSKKTRLKKILICILYHDHKIDLLSLIDKINKNSNTTILVIVDGKKKISYEKKITKLNNRVKFIYSFKKRTVSYNRNLCIKYARKKFDRKY